MGSRRTILGFIAVAVIAGAIGAGGGYYGARYEGFKTQENVSEQFQKVTMDSELIPITGNPVKGSAHPKAVVVVFVDFHADGAKRIHQKILETAFHAHQDEVAVVYKAYPITKLNADSALLWQAANAAHLQNKFWEMADELFEYAGKPFDKATALSLAQKLNLNVEQFEKDFDSRTVREMIRTDIEISKKNKVDRTPTVFINEKRVDFDAGGPTEQFMSSLNAAIERVNRMHEDPAFHYFAASEWNLLYEGRKHVMPKIEPANTVQPSETPEMRTFIDINGTPTLGNPDAPVTIVEFTDFECPFCAIANKNIHEVMQRYPDKIRLVFKHYPLPIHAHADAAHRAAEAASLLGNFWDMYDFLFQNQQNLEQAVLEQYAEKIGLPMDRFKSLLDSDNVKNRIKADLSQGSSVQVNSTPSLFINGRRIKGAPTVDKLSHIVDEELIIADRYLKAGTPADDLYKTLIAEENRANFPEPKAEQDTPKAPILLTQGNSYAKGPENAPVVIYQFSEFQCPFCKKAEPTMTQIAETYGDKVKIVFKSFPLDFHKDAKLASEAALAAGAQGKFWEMHDILFKNQKNLTRPALVEYAKWAGLDIEKFERDLDNHTFAEQLNTEIQEGKTAGIAGTPAFVINGKLILGAKPFDDFKTEIDALIE